MFHASCLKLRDRVVHNTSFGLYDLFKLLLYEWICCHLKAFNGKLTTAILGRLDRVVCK